MNYPKLLFHACFLLTPIISAWAFILPSSSSSYLHTYKKQGTQEHVLSASTSPTNSPTPISFEAFQGKNILVVGGSGRVGGSVVCSLLKHGSKVTVGGTNMGNFEVAKDRWRGLYPSDVIKDSIWDKNTAFVHVERESAASFSALSSFGDYDLVVNTAGPFQGKVNTPNGVLEACVEFSVPYIDVCDDYCTAMAAKTKFSDRAMVPCIISTGCWPGVSSLMAKQLTRKALMTYPDIRPNDLDVSFSFFTAGSGGAGSTLLVATFLILAEKALMVVNGRRNEVQPMREYSSIDFGSKIGLKEVAPLNLLETASVHETLGIGNTRSLFGTAPDFWNSLLGVMAQLPPSLLSNEDLMEKLALFSLPIVRVVDYFAGATNAMRCDVSCSTVPDLKYSALYGHENLEPCVGECVVAFCAALLSGNVSKGIHFPEEAISGGDDISSVLKLAGVGAHTLEVTGTGLVFEEVWG